METKIEEAVKRAKVCSPVCCEPENICFILAMEVERLHKLLEISLKSEDSPAKMEISISEPTYDVPEPYWEATLIRRFYAITRE